jgi:heptosyltransferase-2
VNILIIRLSSLGDIILTEPVVRAVREKYPDAVIDFLVKEQFADIVAFFEGISNIIHYSDEAVMMEYDHVIDLHNVLRTMRIRQKFGRNVTSVKKRGFRRKILVHLHWNLLRNVPDVIGRYFETVKPLGITDNGSAPRLMIEQSSKSNVIAICPGAKHWNKRWLPDYFAKTAAALIDLGYVIELHGSSDERELAESIRLRSGIEAVRNRCGEFGFKELARHLSSCSLAITNDSGLMHLASAAGTPVVSIFGPTVREFGFFPRSPRSVVLEADVDCRPCTTIGREDCPKGHFNCMKLITPDQVITSASKLLS